MHSKAYEKLSQCILNHKKPTTRFIIDKEPELAEKYLLLARSIDPSISRGEVAKKLEEILNETNTCQKMRKLESLKQTPGLISRPISYDPSASFKAID